MVAGVLCVVTETVCAAAAARVRGGAGVSGVDSGEGAVRVGEDAGPEPREGTTPIASRMGIT